jgi:Macrocin-O-methyltransferase (TylF)
VRLEFGAAASNRLGLSHCHLVSWTPTGINRSLAVGWIRNFVNRFRPSKIVRREIDAAMNRWLRDIDFGLRLRAILDSADFVYEHIPLHKRFDPVALRKKAFDMAPAHGLLMEFGVWKGMWINRFASWTDRPVYGFDSFEGLPEPWTFVDRGFFAIQELPKVRDNVTLVKGWFDQTLPRFLETRPEPAAFLHIDCDVYSSTKTVLDLLKDRIVAGTTIVLDDFMMQPGWQRAEYRAWQEFVDAHQVEFDYLGYQTGLACSVAVQITKPPCAVAAAK